MDLKVFTVARRGQLRGLCEGAVGPGRSDRHTGARRMPEVVEMEASKRAGTLALDEHRREREREAIAGRIVLEVLALGFANGEGLSKKAPQTRVLCMSGGARSSTLKKKLFGWKPA